MVCSPNDDSFHEERRPPTLSLTLKPAVDEMEVMGRAREGTGSKVVDDDSGGGGGDETDISDVRGGAVELG